MRRVAGSLKRVFVGDSTFRGDGLRRIWHRGENTTDVVSWVDRQGQIMRQEFTFGGLVVRWERERGVISGSEQGGGDHSVPSSQNGSATVQAASSSSPPSGCFATSSRATSTCAI